ncbi:hypothetical protein [Thalassotalea crassostreae]|uniref:hypothetical protein n=1 Tax=Thalassotalea crassostreae TaxID=1763536 RepID=UPI0012FD86B8|nr:hypothetical protein [Thalassotalea crassostreae]
MSKLIYYIIFFSALYSSVSLAENLNKEFEQFQRMSNEDFERYKNTTTEAGCLRLGHLWNTKTKTCTKTNNLEKLEQSCITTGGQLHKDSGICVLPSKGLLPGYDKSERVNAPVYNSPKSDNMQTIQSNTAHDLPYSYKNSKPKDYELDPEKVPVVTKKLNLPSRDKQTKESEKGSGISSTQVTQNTNHSNKGYSSPSNGNNQNSKNIIPERYKNYHFSGVKTVTWSKEDIKKRGGAFMIETGDKERAENDVKTFLINKASKQCKDDGYKYSSVFGSNYKINELLFFSTHSCKSINRMGVTFWHCQGSGEYQCGARQ